MRPVPIWVRALSRPPVTALNVPLVANRVLVVREGLFTFANWPTFPEAAHPVRVALCQTSDPGPCAAARPLAAETCALRRAARVLAAGRILCAVASQPTVPRAVVLAPYAVANRWTARPRVAPTRHVGVSQGTGARLRAVQLLASTGVAA